MRKSLSKKLRFEIFKRDLFTCQYCGETPPKVILHVDHIVPVALGGGNEIDNLITSCQPCNAGKGKRSLSDIPESLRNKSEKIKESEAQITAYNAMILEKKERLEHDTWLVIDEFIEDSESIEKRSFNTVKSYVDRLGLKETIEAAEIVVSKGFYGEITRLMYFCGICRNKLKKEDV